MESLHSPKIIRHSENKIVMYLTLSEKEAKAAVQKIEMAQQPEPRSRQLKLCNIFIFGIAYSLENLKINF